MVEYIQVVFVIVGIIFFVLSLNNYTQIFRFSSNKKILLYWKITFFLTIFFMGGYFLKIYELLATTASDMMVALVYMFGAMFVFLVTQLSLMEIMQVTEKAKVGKRMLKLINNIRERRAGKVSP